MDSVELKVEFLGTSLGLSPVVFDVVWPSAWPSFRNKWCNIWKRPHSAVGDVHSQATLSVHIPCDLVMPLQWSKNVIIGVASVGVI